VVAVSLGFRGHVELLFDVVTDFYLRVVIRIRSMAIAHSKANNVPATTLAFLTLFAKARGNRFAFSTHDTPESNQQLVSKMALIISYTICIGADFNDNS
jgi:hypothetical protein